MNVIVTAGGRSEPDEPLYPQTRGGYKAMLPVAGKPMVQWVLDALNAANSIKRIVLVGLPVESSLDCHKPLTMLPDEGEMVANIQAGARVLAQFIPENECILVCSSDIPCLTAEMVDWLSAQVQAADVDICYNVIDRSVMEARFPTSRRTYISLKDRQVCGGDINAVRLNVALGKHSFAQKLVAARKSPLRQAALIGFDTLFLLLLRRLSLEEAEKAVCKKLEISGRALVCPYAELGMDVDKPFQLEILEQALSTRS